MFSTMHGPISKLEFIRSWIHLGFSTWPLEDSCLQVRFPWDSFGIAAFHFIFITSTYKHIGCCVANYIGA